MATTYLSSGDTNYTVSNNGTKVIGSTGTESVIIGAGVTGVELDQNTESVTLAGNSSTYTFQQTGNVINVYAADGTTLITKLPLAAGATDTSMTFDDGEKALVMSSTDGSMTLGRGVISAKTASAVASVAAPATNVAVNATTAAGALDASASNVTFGIAQSDFTQTITGFAIGDVLDFTQSASGVFSVRNAAFGDGNAQIQYSDGGTTAVISLTGLAAGMDTFNLTSSAGFDLMFGAGTIA